MIIGLDVGGTHTDAVLLGDDRILRQAKVPTDQANLFDCVWAGLDEVTGDIPPGSIRRAVLSTTLTTNAIAEGKTAEVGTIVSGGPGIDPECFRTGTHYHSVAGSIDHRGRQIQSINSREIKKIAARFSSDGIRHVAVVGKFSVRNPAHELLIRDLLGDSFENIVLGHQISGNLNFPRRISTAYLNAAVFPIHKRFFTAVRESLSRKGLNIPIYILKADGGTMNLDASLHSPGQTILSGPAASVMGALPFASETGETLVLDIGGTTTDMAVLVRGIPLLEPLGGELGGFKTLIRSLNTQSIPMGGDSAVRVVDGELKIGPQREGPAMAYGGTVPTPTDALFVLGEIANGDARASQSGISTLSGQLGIPLEETAVRIFDRACAEILVAAGQMIEKINSKPVYTVQQLLEGYRVKPGNILVLGGPALHFAKRLAALTDSRVQVVPQWHVANAIGAGLAKNTCEVALFADTSRGTAMAPEEGFYRSVQKDFNRQQALELACELLKQKHLREGAEDSDPEIEIIEDAQFNMIRGFNSTGRNIRIRVQVKPGLIPEYRKISESLFNCDPPGEATMVAGPGDNGR